MSNQIKQRVHNTQKKLSLAFAVNHKILVELYLRNNGDKSSGNEVTIHRSISVTQ